MNSAASTEKLLLP